MNKLFACICLLLFATGAKAQEEMTLAEQNAQKIALLESSVAGLNNLKISGYVQGQWQWAQQAGAAAFADGGSFAAASRNRFMIRRGRIKFAYTKGIVQVVFQPEITDKGISVKDVYVAINSPSKVIGGQIGVFDRPFGYEISYSSSLRESPERSRVFLSLFPGERGTGAMLSLKGKEGVLADITLNAGLFNGNGIGVETDSYKDFIGRIAWLKKMNTAQVGLAFSYYGGSVINPTAQNFTFTKEVGFKENSVEKGAPEARQYFGFGVQYLQQSVLGVTNIRAEFLTGKQPGTIKTNADPGGTSLGAGTDPLYLRQFNGYYAILVQDIGTTKHSVVLKYDRYDPNVKIAADQIGKLAGTGAADVAYNTFGFGYLFRWNDNLRLMAYYDIVDNEHCPNLPKFESKIKQNVFTGRVQVKF